MLCTQYILRKTKTNKKTNKNSPERTEGCAETLEFQKKMHVPFYQQSDSNSLVILKSENEERISIYKTREMHLDTVYIQTLLFRFFLNLRMKNLGAHHLV